MILVFQTGHPQYRLRSYNSWIQRAPLHYDGFRVYGPQYAGMENAPRHIIDHFDPAMSLHDVCDRFIGREPDAIFLFSSSKLTQVAHTDFGKFACPVYLLITDAVSWDDGRAAALKLHTLKPFKAVLHNYLFRYQELKDTFPAEHYELYQCWGAHDYDSEAQPVNKDLEFMISGVPGGDEYIHRDLFAAAVKGQGLSAHAALGPRINEPDNNATFLRDLLRSKYSPHDGGINGRLVPRYAESCFARSVIVSPDLGEEMRRAGYVNGKNCILFPREDYMTPEKCLEIIEQTRRRTDWGDLASHAYDLARTRHCTDVRIKRFLEMAL